MSGRAKSRRVDSDSETGGGATESEDEGSDTSREEDNGSRGSEGGAGSNQDDISSLSSDDEEEDEEEEFGDAGGATTAATKEEVELQRREQKAAESAFRAEMDTAVRMDAFGFRFQHDPPRAKEHRDRVDAKRAGSLVTSATNAFSVSTILGAVSIVRARIADVKTYDGDAQVVPYITNIVLSKVHNSKVLPLAVLMSGYDIFNADGTLNSKAGFQLTQPLCAWVTRSVKSATRGFGVVVDFVSIFSFTLGDVWGAVLDELVAPLSLPRNIYNMWSAVTMGRKKTLSVTLFGSHATPTLDRTDMRLVTHLMPLSQTSVATRVPRVYQLQLEEVFGACDVKLDRTASKPGKRKELASAAAPGLQFTYPLAACSSWRLLSAVLPPS